MATSDAPVPTPAGPKYEYKVVEIEAAPAAGSLEAELNGYAAQGWRLVTVLYASSIPGLCIILEKGP